MRLRSNRIRPMRAWATAGLAAFGVSGSASAGPYPAPDEPPYVIVVDRTAQGAPYAPAAEALAALRQPSQIIVLDEGGLGPVFAQLGEIKPRFVAFVVPPSRIEDNFVADVFERATKVDAEPDLDFAYGYITGATGADALAMVKNTARAEADRASIPRKFVGVGHTFREGDLGLFAIQQQALHKAYGYKSEAINPIDESKEWEGSIAAEMMKLDGASLVYFAGHGMGDWCCGVDAERFEGFTLDRAVVANGACHSAVVSVRHDISPQTMGIVTVPIPLERSICLRLIHAGAIAQLGSTASSSWMNVGSAIPAFFNEGQPMGEALQGSLNAHIEREGIRTFKIIPFKDGEPSPQFLGPDRNPGHIQSISRVVLIGDPAYRFTERPIASVPYPAVPARLHPMGDAPAMPAQAAARPATELVGKTIADLVAHLDTNPMDGFVTLNETIRRGEPAVAPLIEALARGRSWQVPKALGALSDERAVPPLIDALGKNPPSPYKDVVVEALELITGKKLGDDAAAWREWLEREGERRE